MPGKEKKNKSRKAEKNIQDNKCPKKDGDNCLVSGVYSDSDPIGGGG